MKTKTLLAVTALMLAPSLAMAMGCSGKYHDQQAASCMPGTSWDAEKQACVETPTG